MAARAREKKLGPDGQPLDDVGTRTGFKRYQWEFKDSNREFWTMGHAPLKFLMMICLITGLKLFETVATHPILSLLLSMEVSILTFFIFLHTFAVHRYMPFIFWPAADLFNDLFTCGFLVGGIHFAVNARRILPTNYLTAVVLMGVAAFFAFIDVCLQRKHFKGKKLRKSALIPPDKEGKTLDENLIEAAMELIVEPEEKKEEERKEKEKKEKEEKEKKKKEKKEKKKKKKKEKKEKKK